MMGKNESLLREFLSLDYSPGVRANKIKDILLTETIVLRSNFHGLSVNYMHDGSKLFIPWSWEDVWSSLHVYAGEYILFTVPGQEGAYIEKMVYLMTKFQDLYVKRGRGNEILEILSEICVLKTDSIRKMLEQDYGIELDPFEFTSSNKDFKI